MKEQKRKFVEKRLKKLKATISKDWYDALSEKKNILFKSNGIYCSCHRCRAYKRMSKYDDASYWTGSAKGSKYLFDMKVANLELHSL